ncbi:MAG TPA: DUF1573 domain-containing protein [Thermoanaerobaculia bacterium]|nr:DUF1573 domain-containing protein [Thermoanaerobaculia bacterium]
MVSFSPSPERAAKAARSFLLFGRHPRIARCGAGAVLASFAALVSAAPNAVVRDSVHDFGRVRLGAKILHSFPIHNSGDAPLELTGARLSDSGMTCHMPPRIPPAGDGAIDVEWSTGNAVGALRGRVSLRTNDPSRPEVPLVLEGKVYGPLDVDPFPAVFLSAFRDEDVRRELTFTSNQSRPVDLRLLPSPGSHYRAGLETVEAGKKWRLTAGVESGTGPGRYEESLRLESSDPQIGAVRIPVHLFIKADLYANPDSFDFGDVPLERVRRQPGALALLRQAVFLKKRRGGFHVRAVRSDVAALDLGATPPTGESGSFEILAGLRADALHPGSLDGTVTIETDDPGFPVLTIPVRGRIVEK